MEITDDLLSVFTGRVEERNGSYVFEIPEREIDIGDIAAGQTYRVAVTRTADDGGSASSASSSTSRGTSTGRSGGRGRDVNQPPVEEGEIIDVEIEDVGEQGDGLARVDRGYVVIVPDTTPGDRPTIEITTVRENVAFGEVVEENAVN